MSVEITNEEFSQTNTNSRAMAIYDITNPDSVIAAAIFSSVTGIRPVSITSRPDLSLLDEVWFIGTEVIPSAAVSNVFQFEYDDTIKNNNLNQITLPANEYTDSALGHPKSITYLMCNYFSSVPHISEMQGAAWVLGTALESFIACEQNGGHNLTEISPEARLESVFKSRRDRDVVKTMVPVTDVPVLVYYNYYEALEYVENFPKLKDLHFILRHTTGDKEKDQYLSFMSKLKQRINRAWYAQLVGIDSKAVSMPVIQLEMDVIPFAMRFIAFAHDRVILVGPDGAGSRWYVFTRKGDYMAIRKLIETQSKSNTVVEW